MLICVLFFVCVVTSPAVARVTEPISSSCNLDDRQQFACPDGVCLGLEHVCDGIDDCLDGSDEAACDPDGRSHVQSEDLEVYRYRRQSGCKKFQWQCRDGTCISFDGKCDGAVDCPDRSDETHALCRKMLCQPNWFRCTYGACVDGTAPCNGVTECADNSDELLPRCRNDTQKMGVQFKCQDGSLISAFDHCDGTPNCPDGSDETVAACADKTCPSYLFQCAYGACVDQGADCNGIQECADGSDESDELCNRIGTPDVTKPTPTPKPGNCILPPYPDHGTYEVSNLPSARPGQSFGNYVITVSCQRGYGLLEPDGGTDGNGTETVYCLGGVMYQDMPECVQFCRLDPDPSVRFMCQIPGTNGFKACKHYVAPGTTVNPICNTPNYYSSEILRYMKCIGGSWDYIAQCKAECGRVTPEGAQLVVGGWLAKRGELPWHVGIYRKTSNPFMQICGGSLVSNNVVISAAHCFWNDITKKQPASNYAVAVGKLYRPWNNERDVDAQKSDVKEINIPSLFLGSAANFQEDIAIVILVTPFVYQTYVRPVCLNFDTNFERRQLVPNKLGKVAGWGLTEENGNASQVLKVVEMPYINIDTCINTLPPSFREYITGDKICAGYTNGTALCKGDSGGGLAFADQELGVDRYYLRGVVSTAPNNENLCNANTYTTFTKITKHEDLIKEYL
ncbi:unnamed protein product [Arctia plantaginis]|uniref:Peptidase S1 domain-containing protein n=1 Tax=Arctia plantaginis TaxID=874455 RepID=A0A8S0ZKM1_ARCPL|nr:unnamed protein product [Arctia plantaginis]